ncbi:MAG: MFS transporter, partial [Vagococcus sp.]
MNKWLKFTMLYIGAVVVGLSQLKITPIIKPLAEQLQVNMTQMSLLTSVFTISGIFIAIPGGILVSRYGAKKLLLI